MTLMDCYQKLLKLDLRDKSKFMNGEYGCQSIVATLGMSHFVKSHIGSISKDVKHSQERIAQELPGVAYYVG